MSDVKPSTSTSESMNSSKNSMNMDRRPTCKSSQLRFKLPFLAGTCNRFAISDWTGAAIASAALQDFSLITAQGNSNLVHKSKLRRQRGHLNELREDI